MSSSMAMPEVVRDELIALYKDALSQFNAAEWRLSEADRVMREKLNNGGYDGTKAFHAFADFREKDRADADVKVLRATLDAFKVFSAVDRPLRPYVNAARRPPPLDITLKQYRTAINVRDAAAKLMQTRLRAYNGQAPPPPPPRSRAEAQEFRAHKDLRIFASAAGEEGPSRAYRRILDRFEDRVWLALDNLLTEGDCVLVVQSLDEHRRDRDGHLWHEHGADDPRVSSRCSDRLEDVLWNLRPWRSPFVLRGAPRVSDASQPHAFGTDLFWKAGEDLLWAVAAVPRKHAQEGPDRMWSFDRGEVVYLGDYVSALLVLQRHKGERPSLTAVLRDFGFKLGDDVVLD